MDKCRTCKWFKLFRYGYGCEKKRRIIVGGRDIDCEDYETNHDVIDDILQKHRSEKVRRFFKTLSDDKS